MATLKRCVAVCRFLKHFFKALCATGVTKDYCRRGLAQVGGGPTNRLRNACRVSQHQTLLYGPRKLFSQEGLLFLSLIFGKTFQQNTEELYFFLEITVHYSPLVKMDSSTGFS